MRRVTLTITNMHCPACNIHLEGLEDDLPGIVFIQANYKKQRMDVEFDEAQIQLDKIRAAVVELGYDISD
jgi:copper chaperone CopZ